MVDIEKLNAHRKQTVLDILELLKTNKRVACVRYPSYGKSYYIVKELVPKLEGDIIIVVPTDYLSVTYKEWFYNYSNVHIITYQILRNKKDIKQYKIFRNVKYFICDECHHLGDNKWRDDLEEILNKLENQVKVIGLTATPLRADGVNVIDEFFNGVQVGPLTMLDAIELNFIPKVKYVVGMLNIDDEIDKRLSDVDRYKVNKLLNVPMLLKKYIDRDRIKDNLKILVFTSETREIKNVTYTVFKWFREIFTDIPINVYQVSYLNTVMENRNAFTKFEKEHKNTIDIMVSIDKLGEGVHLPKVSVEMMLRKTGSPVVFTQQMGRVIGNPKPLVIDLVNNASGYIRINKKNRYNQIKKDIDNIHEVVSEKLMYNNCVEVYDETRELREIISKYVSYLDTNRIPKLVAKNIEYIKSNPDNLSIKGMATKLDVPYRTFIEYVKRTKIMEYKPNKTTNEIITENIEYIKSNPKKLTFKELAHEFGINEHYMRRVLKDKNIKVNGLYKNGNQIKQAREIYKCNKDYIINNPDKLSINKMAEKLNISITTFRSLLKENGIKYKGKISNEKRGIQLDKYILDNKKYIELNPDNLSLCEMAEKLNIKSMTSLKHHMLNNKISFDNYEYYKTNPLFPNMKELLANKTYIITNPKKLSKKELGKEFGVSERQIGMILVYFKNYT